MYPGGRHDPEILDLERILPEGEFARRVAAKVLPSPARIYPEFDYGLHVKDLEFDPRLPVELAVDAGYYPSHYAVLALQVVAEDGMEVVHQVDEIWEHHLVHYDVIEIMACPGGCVNGGGQPYCADREETIAQRIQGLYTIDDRQAKRKSHENPSILKLYAEFLGEPGSHQAHELLHVEYRREYRPHRG